MYKACERCGKPIKPDTEKNEFNYLCGIDLLSYRQVRPPLCAECAWKAMNDEEDGIYYETCEECGKEFDLVWEWNDYDEGWLPGAWDHLHKILCCRCARKLERLGDS